MPDTRLTLRDLFFLTAAIAVALTCFRLALVLYNEYYLTLIALLISAQGIALLTWSAWYILRLKRPNAESLVKLFFGASFFVVIALAIVLAAVILIAPYVW